nr:DUF1987 domain-containing protein [uncultured Carboxylicivirga sp.]
MKPLVIAETSKTPFVFFNPDKGKFFIGGKSIPENVSAFYGSVIKWLDNFVEDSSTEVELYLIIEQINTGSIDSIFQLLKILDKYYLKGKKILVKWYCEERDEDMLKISSFFRKKLQMPIQDIKIDFIDKTNN